MTSQGGQRVVVIGAGHNGLTCAGLLARAGLQVTLVEALAAPGGMASAATLADGYRVPQCAHLLLSPDARVVRDLALHAQGFAGLAPVTTVAMHAAAPALRLGPDTLAGDGVTENDVTQYRRFRRLTDRFSEVLADVATRPPPRLGDPGLAAHLEALRLGLAARRLDKVAIRELLRIGSSNVHDVLDDYVDNERVRAALAMDGVLGAALGPRSNNSVLNLLHRNLGRGAARRRALAVREARTPGAVGVQAFVDALVAAALGCGVTLRTQASVRRLLLEAGRVGGVELDSGEILHADVVVSSLDPRSTLIGLAGSAALEASVLRRIGNLRSEGRAAKLHLALHRMPAWHGIDLEALVQTGHQLRFLLAPDRRTVERAFDASKYGEVPAQPALEFVLPSLHDPSLCASGGHVLSAIVQHAPYQPRAGLEAAREALLQASLTALESVAPDLRQCVTAAELLMPADIEARFGVAGGHWHHGELCVDQYLMLRPVNGLARYAAPLDGLYLCGAGTHPGGNVTGTPGYNAATTVLGALGRTTRGR